MKHFHPSTCWKCWPFLSTTLQYWPDVCLAILSPLLLYLIRNNVLTECLLKTVMSLWHNCISYRKISILFYHNNPLTTSLFIIIPISVSSIISHWHKSPSSIVLANLLMFRCSFHIQSSHFVSHPSFVHIPPLVCNFDEKTYCHLIFVM